MKPLRAVGIASMLVFLAYAQLRAEGYRTTVGTGEDKLPVVVVRGTPYEMGYAFGKLTSSEARQFLERIRQLAQAQGPARMSDEALDAAWKAVGPHTSARYKEEMRGLAEGIGLPLETVRRAHMIPVVSNYSCSALAAWGEATKDGHLYQTRNLDWWLKLRAHDFPCLVVYLPKDGAAHINVTFAGCIGANTGMNASGIVLSQMGDSPGRDYPFNLDGEHFLSMFRDMLSDCRTLDQAIAHVQNAKRIKKYHYVIGAGQQPAAVKMRAHAPELLIWHDADPQDELAPAVLKNVVYQDEGRGAFEPLKQAWGHIDADTMIDIARRIPIKGGNVLDVVYDATALELWVSYAKDDTEAYKRPFVHVRLADYLRYDPKGTTTVNTSPGANE